MKKYFHMELSNYPYCSPKIIYGYIYFWRPHKSPNQNISKSFHTKLSNYPYCPPYIIYGYIYQTLHGYILASLLLESSRDSAKSYPGIPVRK